MKHLDLKVLMERIEIRVPDFKKETAFEIASHKNTSEHARKLRDLVRVFWNNGIIVSGEYSVKTDDGFHDVSNSRLEVRLIKISVNTDGNESFSVTSERTCNGGLKMASSLCFDYWKPKYVLIDGQNDDVLVRADDLREVRGIANEYHKECEGDWLPLLYVLNKRTHRYEPSELTY